MNTPLAQPSAATAPVPFPTEALRELLASPKRIALVTHIRPDGDALGSTLGLWHLFQALGHTPKVLLSSAVPSYLAWMPGIAEAVHVAEGEGLAEGLAWLASADVLVCLDFGIRDRVGPGLAEAVQAWAKPVLHLDHHLAGEDFTPFRMVDTEASSTCELALRLWKAAYPAVPLSPAAATCLYTGIMTDTGSFRFDATTPAVHRAVADLIEAGVAVGRVHHLAFSSNTEARTRFLGHCLSERLVVLPALRAAYLTVPMDVQAHYGVRAGDTEGLVNYALGIQGVNLGVLMTEHPGEIRMSFRSVGAFAASEFAGQFGGGGHYNAAGGRSHASLAETEARLRAAIEAAGPQLQYEMGV
jgi:bifunctional oligoribonuclease and PAP phosphatase NrnA